MLPKSFRLALALVFGLWPLAAGAQTTPSAPTLPLAGVYYRYWPEQLVQWLGPELPYSMIVLDVDDRGKQPIYDVQLIPRAGGQLVRYTNSADELAIDQRLGGPVHQVAMQFDGPSDPANGAQYMLRFNTETGTPIVWQFVLGTDVTEEGSGLSPTGAAIPILMYRELGGLAGAGTALQMGSVTSTADVWKEIAQPPYFVPYRGALSTGVHVLTFAPGAVAWKGDAQSLSNASGLTLGLTKDNDNVVMTNKALGTTAAYTVAGSAITRVTFSPAGGKRDHLVSLQFSPALSPGAQSSFDVIAGKKTKIASGTVLAANADAGLSETWSFTTPDSLKGSTAQATASLQH